MNKGQKTKRLQCSSFMLPSGKVCRLKLQTFDWLITYNGETRTRKTYEAALALKDELMQKELDGGDFYEKL